VKPWIRRLLLLVAVLAALVVYTWRLDRAPVYLANDETVFALQAHAIATTARDEDGRFLPLYFHVVDNMWYHPALVYAMAPVMAVAPPEPWAVRLPTALLAVANIVLVFVLARRLGASDVAAIGASVLLTIMPAHVLHGRLACDYLFPIPCVLIWLILLIDYKRLGTSWRLFAAGAVLGLGLYTYIASLVTMPVLLMLTFLALPSIGVRQAKPYALVAAGFLLLALPLAIWLVSVPEVYAGFAGRYRDTGADVVRSPLGFFQLKLMKERWSVYSSFFNWSFLFDRAETFAMSSTYTTGVFLKGMSVLLAVGLYHVVRNRRTAFTMLVLAVFLCAPLAASLVNERYTIDRALVLVPAAALIGAFGIDWLIERRRLPLLTWAGRAVCAGLMIWMAVQFKDFYRDYMTDYRARSAFWFNGNHPGAFAPIVQDHPAGGTARIYLSESLPWVRQHWKLYLLRTGRMDLLPRTVYFSPDRLDLASVRPGSVLLTGWDDQVSRAFAKSSAVTMAGVTTDLDGSVSFVRFERAQN
jgi:4-amino-4-deoxy-L-arabinose transferase-like glycosyltransferase